MKTFSKFALALVILIIPAVSFAAEFRVGDQPSIRAGESMTGNAYVAGGNVTSAGTIPGDLVAGGGTVVVSGDVGADVLAGGGNVTILSNVGGDVRAAGGNVVVQGKVGGDLIVGGGQITIGGPGVAGDVAIGGGTVRIDAPITGNVRIGGGSVYINAPITGDLNIEADTVTLGSAAVISGDITYGANKELAREEGAVVNGAVHFEPRPERAASAAPALAFAAVFSFWVLGKFLALFVCALVIGLAFRRYSREVVAKATARPLSEIGKGLIVFAALPVISVLLLVTMVGIPFGILGLIGFVVAMLFAWIITPIIVGSIVYQYFSKGNPEVSWKTILLGAFLYTIIGFVPFLGWLVQMLLMFLALGVITSIKMEIIRQWR